MCTAEVEKMIEAAVPRSKVLIGQATAPGGLLYRDIFEDFTTIHLETAIDIMQRTAAPFRDHGIEKLRGPCLVDRIVTDFSPADDEVISLIQLRDHARQQNEYRTEAFCSSCPSDRAIHN